MYKWIIGSLVCGVVAVIIAALPLPGGIGPAALPPSVMSLLSGTLSHPTGTLSPMIPQHTCRFLEQKVLY